MKKKLCPHSIVSLFLVVVIFLLADESKLVTSQTSLNTKSWVVSKRLNELFLNSKLFVATSPLQKSDDTHSLVNATQFRESLKLFQFELLKKRNALCLYEIHRRFDWSLIKLDTFSLSNYTIWIDTSLNEKDTSRIHRDHYFNELIDKLTNMVS